MAQPGAGSGDGDGDGDDGGGSALYQVSVPEKRGFKALLAYIGPGFLVAIAYIDPGNFESDLQSGAKYKYELLWIILIASSAALLIQSLAANLGVVTGKHLAEHCRTEYPRKVTLCLWIAAEIAIVASDIPEVLGTAFALNLLFHIPVWSGVLITGLSTLILLALQQYGVRKLEMLIALLVFTMAGCYFAELGYARPPAVDVLKGLFVPRLEGNGATGLAISLLGAMVMPHNLFLHSALVLSRKTPRTVRGIKDAKRFYFIESAFALFVAFLINVSVISVSGALCANPNLSPDDREKCDNLNLNQASFLLEVCVWLGHNFFWMNRGTRCDTWDLTLTNMHHAHVHPHMHAHAHAHAHMHKDTFLVALSEAARYMGSQSTIVCMPRILWDFHTTPLQVQLLGGNWN